MKIKKNDNVIVIAGKDKGKKSKVLKTFKATERVLVEGVNLKKKHQKPRKQGEKGQMIEVAHPVNVSNLLIFCSSCGKGVKTGSTLNKNIKIRVCRKCGKEV